MNQDHSNPTPTPKPSIIPVIIHDQKENFFNKLYTNATAGTGIKQVTIPVTIKPIQPETPSKVAVRSSEMLKPTYRPMMKSILIEALYSLIFTHHIPILMKQGTLMDDTPLINFQSIPLFLTSYFGKIIFFLTIYFTLHHIFLPFIRKIDFP
jgi:prolipoprotein diacylglyceryltransferase